MGLGEWRGGVGTVERMGWESGEEGVGRMELRGWESGDEWFDSEMVLSAII